MFSVIIFNSMYVSKERLQIAVQFNLRRHPEILYKLVAQPPPHGSMGSLPLCASFLGHRGHHFSLVQMLMLF